MRGYKPCFLNNLKIDPASLGAFKPLSFLSRSDLFPYLPFLIGLILTGLVSMADVSYAFPKDQKTVLVLHSYRSNYQWTDKINHGITDVFKKNGDEVKLQIEYMDIKKGNDKNHFEILKELYRHKYKGIKFESIICSDNYALNFILDNRNALFKDVPVVFCGINRFKDSGFTPKK